jgi:hypothetical protein
LAALFRVNAGGAELAGSPVWQADTAAAPSSFSNAAAGNLGTSSTAAAINMTDPSLPAGTPMALFQTERFDKPGSPNMLWDFPVSPGQYEVRLYFAETYSGAFASGARVFDVTIEGQTVLDNYDVFADVGANTGVMKSFVVTSDSNLDIDFSRVTQNPSVKGIEILSTAAAASPLNASATSFDFGSVTVGQTASRQVTLTNNGQAGGATITIDPAAASLAPAGLPFSFSFAQSTPIVLAPGQSTLVTLNYSPTAATASSVTFMVPHNGSNGPISVSLAGQGVAQTGSLYRIDAGGAGAAGSPAWTADTAANPSSFSNAASGGNSAVFTTLAAIDMSSPSIPAGTPMSIFQTERFDKPSGAELLWDFPVAPGAYEVRLYFAENYSGAFSVGARVFDVSIEGAVVLDNYDVYADVGGNKGVVKTFTVNSDAHLNIDFTRVVQNPSVKAIEIVPAQSSSGTLTASSTSVTFSSVLVGSSSSQQVTLTNSAASGGASITIDPGTASISPGGSPYSFNFGQSMPITLAPGQSAPVTITYSPASAVQSNATLSIPNDASSSPLQIALSGTGATSVPVSFGKSTLDNTPGLSRPTSLQFGPDGRLYVAQQNGLIRVYTIARDAANQYEVTAEEQIALVQQIPNHNDDGGLNGSVTTRLVTGLLVTGTAANPVLYVTSSDPRIGGGNSGVDLNLDTNSSTVSRLTKNGGTWTKVDLVRGLPRSEENHAANGLQLDPATNTLYVAMGGNTNMGAPSNNFSLLPEYAYSAAIIKIDLNAIGNTTYDLPTLDDETRAGATDANDPFGGDDGRNQARIVPGGPVQIYAPGFRNPYDIVITSSGRMYTVDNGPNAGWGDVPIGEGPNGTATNGVHEPGVSQPDSLHFITGQGYYGGHPDPTRANTANTFNTSNPQSPVVTGNPIEGDYRAPGPENGALALFPESTNGLTEYVTNNFAGALKGDLLIASFDNTVKRVKLSADGTQAVLTENLFTNVGAQPLDVTAPSSGAFAGSIWVCDIGTSKIYVFEPTSGTTGNLNDLDGDGYLNDDETANGTDPNNPGDVPTDFDHDFASDLTDPNDDNDAFPDTSDKFAVDAANGSNTPVGTFYDWENEGASPGGLLGLGFTGLMTNGTSNYASLYDHSKLTAGGAAGVLTLDRATVGTALGSANTQEQAFQFGVNVGGQTAPFVAETSVLGPWSGLTPHVGEEMGFYLGTGDQDNYLELVLTGDSGGSIKLAKEVGGTFTTIATQPLAMPGSGFVELHLSVNPDNNTVQASYSVSDGASVNLGGATAIPASWISSVMAVGLISTDSTPASAVPATWDFLAVVPGVVVTGDAAAKVEVFTQGSLDNSSTAKTDSFRIHNNATGGRKISSVTFDLRTAFMPDMVFDPNGTGGDTRGIDFTADSGGAATGLGEDIFAVDHDGGFDTLTIDFDDFDPGEVFTFHVDVDPTSVRGSAPPGPADAASVSGLEISGATITVHYEDGGVINGQLFALPEGSDFYKVHSQATLNESPATAAPQISLVGVTTPAVVQSAAQKVHIVAPPGSTVRLLQTEVALQLAGVPGGGFDIDPYEANKVVFVRDDVATVPAAGFIDVNVTLHDSRTEGGINYFTAVIELPGGETGAVSNVLKVALKNLPPGSNAPAALLSPGPPEFFGDYNGDGIVDGADFLLMQHSTSTGDDMQTWQAGFADDDGPPEPDTGPEVDVAEDELGPLAVMAADSAMTAEGEGGPGLMQSLEASGVKFDRLWQSEAASRPAFHRPLAARPFVAGSWQARQTKTAVTNDGIRVTSREAPGQVRARNCEVDLNLTALDVAFEGL